MDNCSKDIELPPPPFRVRTCGRIRNLPYHSTVGTKSGDMMLTVVLAGKGIYQNSVGKRIVTGGMVGLVPPQDPGVLASDLEKPYYHYYCRFNGDYACQVALRILESRDDRFFPFDNVDRLAETLRPVAGYSSKDLPLQMGPRELALAEVLMLLGEHQGVRETPRLSAHAIEEYLQMRLAEPTDLEAMAAFFSVSKATLCRAVRRCCGSTVQKLHEHYKLEWAKTLLQLHTFSIREISLRVGYNDPLYFSRVFRSATGQSPRAWLRSQAKRS